jgi:uncharacterized membrane protein YoaK (UPF0700 family)
MTWSSAWRQRVAITDVALGALAFGSGTMDVASFLVLGNVFTSAMTGNTALLGIALSQGQFVAAAHALAALIGFSIGAAFAAAMGLWMESKPSPRFPDRKAGEERLEGDFDLIRFLLATELLCLISFAAILTFVGRAGENLAVYWLILFSALGMGIQGVAARHIHSPGINTIVFTSTLISIVISLTGLLMRRSADHEGLHDMRRQIGIFLAYACGALLAGMLVGPVLPFVAWLPALAVLSALGCCEAAGKK